MDWNWSPISNNNYVCQCCKQTKTNNGYQLGMVKLCVHCWEYNKHGDDLVCLHCYSIQHKTCYLT